MSSSTLWPAAQRADGSVHATTVRGDRELKLAGYEVFRFGADELIDPQAAQALLTTFFADLFRRFQVSLAPLIHRTV